MYKSANTIVSLSKSTACDQNEIRLVGGENSLEGRVEVCNNSEWKTVCNKGWDNNEAKVVCTQLGYTGDKMG